MRIRQSSGNVWLDEGKRERHHPAAEGQVLTPPPLGMAFGKLKFHRMFPGFGDCLNSQARLDAFNYCDFLVFPPEDCAVVIGRDFNEIP